MVTVNVVTLTILPDNPPLAFLLISAVGWSGEVEALVPGSSLPESRFKLWYPPAPPRHLPRSGGL